MYKAVWFKNQKGILSRPAAVFFIPLSIMYIWSGVISREFLSDSGPSMRGGTW